MTSIFRVAGFHLAQVNQDIDLPLHLCFFPESQSTKRYPAGWESLRVDEVLPNGTIAQLPLVLGKYILVISKHFPELLLLPLFQVVINPNLLGDLFPSCAHLLIV
jgi:hypothetical protein